MQRVSRRAAKLESLSLFAELHRSSELPLHGAESRKEFLRTVTQGLSNALSSSGTLHGFRVQAMFIGMVAALDSVLLIKEEDSGECHFSGDTIAIPDFRIVTGERQALLVEVKNQYSLNPLKPFSIRSKDIANLSHYSSLVGCQLKIAVYWACWNQWTILSPSVFTGAGTKLHISLQDAHKNNEIGLLGDYMVGTRFPLTVRLTGSASVQEDGSTSFRVTNRELYCAGRKVTDPQARNIGAFFMSTSRWSYDRGVWELDVAGNPVAVAHSVYPEPADENGSQNFRILGTMSSMYSAMYQFLSSQDGSITRIKLKNAESLIPKIPKNWRSDELPLWRFVLVVDRSSDS